jgi:hypothetical protein
MIRSQAWTGRAGNGGFYRRVLFRGVMHWELYTLLPRCFRLVSLEKTGDNL